MATSENRAVSALFRVFGGEDRRGFSEIELKSSRSGMHRGETLALSALIPLTVFVAVLDLLIGWVGKVGGTLLTFPISFLVLSLLPFALAGKNQKLQWHLWAGSCIAWALFHSTDSGVVGFLSYVWLVVAVVTAAAEMVLVWRAMMRLPGAAGIAWRVTLVVGLHLILLAIGYKWGWIAGAVFGAGMGATWCLAVLRPSGQWLGDVILTTDQPRPLITIDDGPDPQDTPVLLDLLDRYQTKVIFFMIGEKVRAHPELAREVIRRGHEIGNHTLTHPQASFWCAGPGRTRREIEGCQKIITEVTGVAPRWFRAPVGHRNLFTHPIVAALGMRVMGWNRRGYDAVSADSQKVLSLILPGLKAGDVVLLHEATPIAAEVLDGVLAGWEASGESRRGNC